MKTQLIGLSIAAAFAMHASDATASTVYSGITFPDGDVSFADKLVDYTLGDGVAGTYSDPLSVLGTPDWNGSSETGSFSLGLPGTNVDNLPDDQFGSVTVQFTDNSLTTSGNSDADLFIFEIGGLVESFMVEISANNSDWIDIGTLSGQPTSIDIDSIFGVTQGTLYSFVRVTDVAGGLVTGQANQPYAGPDIDAIGAITSGAAAPVVPLPAGIWFLMGGIAALAGIRRTAKT